MAKRGRFQRFGWAGGGAGALVEAAPFVSQCHKYGRWFVEFFLAIFCSTSIGIFFF